MSENVYSFRRCPMWRARAGLPGHLRRTGAAGGTLTAPTRTSIDIDTTVSTRPRRYLSGHERTPNETGTVVITPLSAASGDERAGGTSGQDGRGRSERDELARRSERVGASSRSEVAFGPFTAPVYPPRFMTRHHRRGRRRRVADGDDLSADWPQNWRDGGLTRAFIWRRVVPPPGPVVPPRRRVGRVVPPRLRLRQGEV